MIHSASPTWQQAGREMFLAKTQRAKGEGRKAESRYVLFAFLCFRPLRLCEKLPFLILVLFPARSG